MFISLKLKKGKTMKKICENGYQASSVDLKALSHYLLVSPSSWGNSALAGMINKAIKSILRDWFEIYKTKQTGNISADYTVLIPAIIAMEEFKPYNTTVPVTPRINRVEVRDIEIWADGFDVEDYEDAALRAFYKDPEAMLEYFMENKIYARRTAFVKEHEKGFFDRKEPIPAVADDFINLVCAKSEYKNRIEREVEII